MQRNTNDFGNIHSNRCAVCGKVVDILKDTIIFYKNKLSNNSYNCTFYYLFCTVHTYRSINWDKHPYYFERISFDKYKEIINIYKVME